MYKVIFFDLGETLVSSAKWVTGAIELLNKLKQKNVKLGIISNTPDGLDRKGLGNFLPGDFNWDLFEESLIILSAEVKIEKPDQRIFQLAVQRSGLAGSSCLYCSENASECLSAQQAGLHAYRVQAPPASDIADLFSNLENLNSLPI